MYFCHKYREIYNMNSLIFPPYVHEGDRFTATGVVSQFAREDPWNGGYRVLVRWQSDLVKE